MKMVEKDGEAAHQVEIDMVRTYFSDASDRIQKNGKDAINGFAGGDEQRMMLLGIKRFTKAQPFNTKDARRRIADRMISEKKYPF